MLFFITVKLAFFDSHEFEKPSFEALNQEKEIQITFFETQLNAKTAILAAGFEGVCAFVNDDLRRETLEKLAGLGVQLIALRCAGFNHVDLAAASQLGLRVVRVPEYSPYAVAEHAVALILTLNRKTHRAYQRVREFNFSLNGLVGFDLYQKNVGVIGTGRIGKVLSQILLGFGCKVFAHDLKESTHLKKQGVEYLPLSELLAISDILSLTLPLTPKTHHLINEQAIARMKKGVMLINTGRGGLIDTQALIKGLKTGHIGSAGLDVYEEEEGIFFTDFSSQVLQDDVLARLLTFPNVLLTSHQGFLTQEALAEIARCTLQNCLDFKNSRKLINEIQPH